MKFSMWPISNTDFTSIFFDFYIGEVIGKPHKYNCFCDPCLRSAKRDELKFAKARLNAYKGLASEAYISLSSEDPILTSFELRKELLNVCTDEKYYTVG